MCLDIPLAWRGSTWQRGKADKVIKEITTVAGLAEIQLSIYYECQPKNLAERMCKRSLTLISKSYTLSIKLNLQLTPGSL